MWKRLTSLTVPRAAVRRYAKAANDATEMEGVPSEPQGKLKGSKMVITGDRGINRVVLLGRAGQDSQVRGSQENPVTVFPLATSFTLKTVNGDYIQKTEWHRVSVFRPVLRDLTSQSIKKGDRVYVQGTISYTQYKDKNDVMQRAANIIADDVINVSRNAHGSVETVDMDKIYTHAAEQ